jgi:hypothetical protein
MAVPTVIWHGTTAESIQLANAIQNNCTCAGGQCPAHAAMLDQKWLDTILFLRWMRERLLKGEGI